MQNIKRGVATKKSPHAWMMGKPPISSSTSNPHRLVEQKLVKLMMARINSEEWSTAFHRVVGMAWGYVYSYQTRPCILVVLVLSGNVRLYYSQV